MPEGGQQNWRGELGHAAECGVGAEKGSRSPREQLLESGVAYFR